MIHNRKLAAAAVLLSCAALSFAQTAVSWQMALFMTDNNTVKSVPFSAPVTLADGSHFQLFVQAAGKITCYVFYEDVKGKFTLLSNTELDAGRNVLLPDSNADFCVSGPSGEETVYVLVSSAKQPVLDKLIADVDKNGDLVKPEKVKAEILRAGSVSTGGTEAAPKQIAAGSFKRGDTVVNLDSTQFSGKSVYLKKIIIKH